MLYHQLMLTNITIIGFGVIGTEILSVLGSRYKQNKKLNIIIVEKNLKNIPGGEAYSEHQSRFGFFNNPLRISNPEFVKWLKKKENSKKLCKLSTDKKYNLKDWLKINTFFCEHKLNKFDELYVPRFFYSFFLKEKIFNIFKKHKKKIKITIIKGELDSIKSKNANFCNLKKYSSKYLLSFKKDKIFFKKTNFKTKFFKTENVVIGTGIIPPEKISSKNKITNKNYINDFYGSRGTYNLIHKIKTKLKIKNIVKIIFIGNKAGLLEAMPELQKMNNKFKKRIKIICISPSSVSLEKAELSKNYKKLQLKIYENLKEKKIKKAIYLYDYVIKEFENGKKDGFSKYDIWTTILKKKILNKLYKSLSYEEKNNYNEHVFTKIRNITRYTYPATVVAKEQLEKNKTLKFVTDRVYKLDEINKKLIVISKKNKRIVGDIVINVSGPSNLLSKNNHLKYLESLKKISKKFTNRGFMTNSSFLLRNNIYIPGSLSINFNPNRLTIIRAITKNAHKVATKISNIYNKKRI